MTNDTITTAVAAKERETYLRDLTTDAPAAIDPVTAFKIATTAYKIAKELGLFGKDTSLEDSISDIYSHINRLYQEIANLHARLDEVRDELINFVLEVEYRNIAADVLGLSRGVGSLSGGEDHGFLDAAFLDSEATNIKLLERLEDNAAAENRDVPFLRYLDLLIYHAACRTVILSGAPSLPFALKQTGLDDLEKDVARFSALAREKLFNIFYAQFRVSVCGNEVFNDDDGTPLGAIEFWGYVREGSAECNRVETIGIDVGGAAAMARNRRGREQAAAKVDAEIRRIATEAAEGVWRDKYRAFTALAT